MDVAEIIFGELVANVVRHAPGPADARDGSRRRLHTRRSDSQNPLERAGEAFGLSSNSAERSKSRPFPATERTCAPNSP
jgi:hypothetical protein